MEYLAVAGIGAFVLYSASAQNEEIESMGMEAVAMDQVVDEDYRGLKGKSFYVTPQGLDADTGTYQYGKKIGPEYGEPNSAYAVRSLANGGEGQIAAWGDAVQFLPPSPPQEVASVVVPTRMDPFRPAEVFDATNAYAGASQAFISNEGADSFWLGNVTVSK